jgi:hypothetical protein
VIGREGFDEQPAPDDLRFWQLREPPRSALHGNPVPVDVVLQHRDLTEEDLAHVTAVVADVDRYLTAAVDFVRQRMAEDPAFFGVEEPLDDVPLTGPAIAVNDDSWLVHFAEGLPICDPYGLAVHFRGDQPVEVEDLSDYEQLE